MTFRTPPDSTRPDPRHFRTLLTRPAGRVMTREKPWRFPSPFPPPSKCGNKPCRGRRDQHYSMDLWLLGIASTRRFGAHRPGYSMHNTYSMYSTYSTLYSMYSMYSIYSQNYGDILEGEGRGFGCCVYLLVSPTLQQQYIVVGKVNNR